jgi:hypothetical protein
MAWLIFGASNQLNSPMVERLEFPKFFAIGSYLLHYHF